MTPSEFTAYWLAQHPTDSKGVHRLHRELAGVGMSARRWAVFCAAYAAAADRRTARRLGRHPTSVVEVLRTEQDAAAEAALAAAIERSPALRPVVARAYSRPYWLEVHGGSARREVARRQARHLIAVASPGWAPDPRWRTFDVSAIVRAMLAGDDFGAMPILADALQDAGCDNLEWLSLMRDGSQPWFADAGVLDTLR